MKKTEGSRIPARCANCAHWTKSQVDDENHEFGECKRYPPSWVRYDDETQATCSFPVTDSMNFCGEFKVRQDA